MQELNQSIVGRRILEIYTQEKDKLFLSIPIGNHPDSHLVISVNTQQPFVMCRESHHKAKRNTITFFERFLPAEIKSVDIACGDRILRIALNRSHLYVIFRGSKSNVILVSDSGETAAFKKVSGTELNGFLDELNKLEFSNSLSWLSDELEEINNLRDLKKLPFLGKEIIREIESRCDYSKHGIQKIIREIISEPIAVYANDDIGKQMFIPRSFTNVPNQKEKDLFSYYCDAINRYFGLSFSRAKSISTKAEIEKYLSKELERLSGKLNNLKARIDAGTKENIYRKYGDILLSNIHAIRKGLKHISLKDMFTHEEILIPLDDKLSPSKNVEKYYDKSRNEKIDFQKSKELFAAAETNYKRLFAIKEKFDKTESQDDLQLIKKELKMDSKTPQLEYKKEKYSFRHFLIDDKYNVFVGKDSKNNDALTTKFAKQNDFWFHARSVSGSHVVLRVENTKEPIPKSILQKAASLAAFYSKAKTSKIAPVTYTLKKYVVKNQRHEPGQVTVTKENVLLVKPEIPKECVLVDE